MNTRLLALAGGACAVLLFLLLSAIFTVHQTQQALVLQFGNPVRIVQEPGLHFKVPFIQQVEFFERRVLDFDAPSVELVLGDQKRLVVDAFARYRSTMRCAFGRRRAPSSRSVAAWSPSSSPACGACWARHHCSRFCRRTAIS
ncbi:MAG: SPFH domain-containing protein [Geminicoccaceae bacterium]